VSTTATRRHTAADYANLMDIDRFDGLTDAQERCIDELRILLQRLDLADQLGVAMLHRHFDVSDDETVVASLGKGSWAKVTRPSKHPIHVEPCMAQLEGDPTDTRLVYLEYSDSLAVSSFRSVDPRAWTEIFGVLRQFGCERVFGVVDRQAFPEIAIDEVLLETCCDEDRSLRCQRVPDALDETMRVVTTQWYWPTDRPFACGACRQTCRIGAINPGNPSGHERGPHTSS